MGRIIKAKPTIQQIFRKSALKERAKTIERKLKARGFKGEVVVKKGATTFDPSSFEVITVSKPQLFTESGEIAKPKEELIRGKKIFVTRGFSKADLVRIKGREQKIKEKKIIDKRPVKRKDIQTTVKLRTLEGVLSRVPSVAESVEAIDIASQKGVKPQRFRIGKFTSGAVIPLKISKGRLDKPTVFEEEGIQLQKTFSREDLARAKILLKKGGIKKSTETPESLARKLSLQRANINKEFNRKLDDAKKTLKFVDDSNKALDKTIDDIFNFLQKDPFLKEEIKEKSKNAYITQFLNSGAKLGAKFLPPFLAINIGGIVLAGTQVGLTQKGRENILKAGKGVIKFAGKSQVEGTKFYVDSAKKVLNTDFTNPKNILKAQKSIKKAEEDIVKTLKKVKTLSVDILKNPKKAGEVFTIILLFGGAKGLDKISKSIAKNPAIKKELLRLGIKSKETAKKFIASAKKSPEAFDRFIEGLPKPRSKLLRSKAGKKGGGSIIKGGKKITFKKKTGKKKVKPISKAQKREQKLDIQKISFEKQGLIGKVRSKGKVAKDIRLKETFKEKVDDFTELSFKTITKSVKKGREIVDKQGRVQILVSKQIPKVKKTVKTTTTRVVTKKPLSQKAQLKQFRKQKAIQIGIKKTKVDTNTQFAKRGVRTGREGKAQEKLLLLKKKRESELLQKQPFDESVSGFFEFTDKSLSKVKKVLVKKAKPKLKPIVKVSVAQKERVKLERGVILLPSFREKVDSRVSVDISVIRGAKPKEKVRIAPIQIKGQDFSVNPLPDTTVLAKIKRSKASKRVKPTQTITKPIKQPEKVFKPLIKSLPKLIKVRKPIFPKRIPKKLKLPKPKILKFKPLPKLKLKKPIKLSKQITFFTQTIVKPSKVKEGKRTKGLEFGDVELFTGTELRGFK